MKNRPFFSPKHPLCAALLLMAAVVPASGQAPAVRIIPAATAKEDPATPPAEAPPVPDPAAAPAAPVPQPRSLGKVLLGLTFDRSPEAVVRGTRAQSKEEEPKPEEAFQMAVLFGDWAAVGKTLADLPPEEGAAVYTKLLDSIARQSVPVGEVLKNSAQGSDDMDPYERVQRMEQDREQQRAKPAPILSEDFYALVDAAPGNLGEDHIDALAKLVKTALGEGGRATLLDRIGKGWKGLGGDTPEGGKLATRLLSALGWIKDAAPFLPLKQEQWEEADTMQLIFAMEYFTQVGIAERDERQLQQAAELCAWLMKTARFGNYTRPQFKLAMDRLVQLLPALDPAAAQKLIREQLFKQTATLADLITIIGGMGQAAGKGKDLKARVGALGTQHLLMEALATMEGQPPPNIAVLVMNWLFEAEACYRAGGVAATEMTQAQRLMMQRYGMSRGTQINSLSTAQILAAAPPEGLIGRLNPGLAQRVKLTLLKINILQPEEANLDLLRAYVKAHPGLEREVCQDVLTGWVSKRTKPAESAQVRQMRAYGMYIPQQMLQQGSGIPLTRLRQNQNIDHFKKLLAELRAISPEPLDPALIVQAFMTLHSGAEVYQLGDIEAIFGPPEKMARGELLNLLDGMRSRLGEQWRSPETQQAAATNRTEEEAKDEVSRGYHTALTLAKRGIPDNDPDWRSFITRGQLFYDASQYEFERRVKLADYVNLRDEAFGNFGKAAEAYAAKLPSLPRGQWTIEPYQAWFFVMLGASDLAQLTINTARVDPGLAGIGDAIRALPGEAGGEHLALFAKMLGELFPRVPANIRQRFLGSGLTIVGKDNPAAKSATASLTYYQELLDEIQLRLTVDGPTSVGHSQPFGAFISLVTTSQLLRESGGFGKYLQNQSNQRQLMGGDGGGARNLRDDFTKNIHAALDNTFEVLSLTFHDGAPKTIDLPLDGMVETPLLYAVLRAKNRAVDLIPSIQLDMDFVDQPGQVVLPVMSQVQPIDANAASVPARPCGELALSLTMDEREWKDGKIVVEIQANGQGIIPGLDEMFDCQRDGFELETVDSNLSVTQFVSDGRQRLPHADRNWQLTYTRKADLQGEVMFPFPFLKQGIQPATIEYKHYQDADLVAIDAARAAAGVKLVSPGGGLRGKGLIAAAAAVLLILLVWLLRRGKSARPQAVVELAVPTDPTPFTTVSFLRRLGALRADRLSEADQSALKAEIAAIEAGYFSPATPPSMDLNAIARKWFRMVKS